MIQLQQAIQRELSLSKMESCLTRFTEGIIVRLSSKKLLMCYRCWEGMQVTFRQFAFNNVLRNKGVYAAYFLSSLFSVLVFFVYAVFAFHPALSKVNPNVSLGLHLAEGIIYVFSFIFVLVSMSAFLKSRKRNSA